MCRDFHHPLVCIPLKIKEHVIGVIVIYKLLVQKSRFAEVDYELFTLARRPRRNGHLFVQAVFGIGAEAFDDPGVSSIF